MDRISNVTFNKSYKNTKYIKNDFLNKLRNILSNPVSSISILAFITGRVSILSIFSSFGAALLISTAVVLPKKDLIIISLSIIMGFLTRGIGYATIEPITVLIITYFFITFLKFNNKTSLTKAALTAFTVNFIVSMEFNLLINGSFVLYYTLIGIVNSVIIITFVYIYNYFLPIIINNRKRRLLLNEELISIAIVCSIIISGLLDVLIYGISLGDILAVLIIMEVSFSYGAGAGTAVATSVGLITCISTTNSPIVIGAYAFCGLMAGIFRKTGKIGTIMGFAIADMIMLFYTSPSSEIIGTRETLIGILLFSIIPLSIINKMIPFLDINAKNYSEQHTYVEKLTDIILTKIRHTVEVFNDLSKGLIEDETSDRARQNTEINSIINAVVDKVCYDCDANNICWKRDFYNTYQNIFDMIDVIQADGSIDIETMPIDLKRKCLKVNLLIRVTNYMFEIYRINYKWRKKSQEGKKVVSEQLDGLVEILNGLSKDITKEVNFEKDMQQEIAISLDKEGILFRDVVVSKNIKGRYEVNVYKKACHVKRECIKEIVPVISKVLNKKMKRDNAYCKIKPENGLCYFKVVEYVKYQMSTGIAKEIKDEDRISGDSYSFTELNDGQYMLVLSDGMGTGPSASKESSMAIDLLEKYVNAGFNTLTALKAINSVMSIKSPDDNFTTIDLATVDLYTGEVKLIKIGAACTFIKRNDGTIDTISSVTLPIGILSNIDAESKTVKISHGDMVVMITDGVNEAGDKNDGWIKEVLEKIESKNPQQVADEIIIQAKNKNNGIIKDDMTVLVSKLWEVI